MKLAPVTKLHKRNTTTSKKIDDDVMSANYDVIVIFLINDQFRAIRKPLFSLMSTFDHTKTEYRTKNL